MKFSSKAKPEREYFSSRMIPESTRGGWMFDVHGSSATFNGDVKVISMYSIATRDSRTVQASDHHMLITVNEKRLSSLTPGQLLNLSWSTSKDASASHP